MNARRLALGLGLLVAAAAAPSSALAATAPVYVLSAKSVKAKHLGHGRYAVRLRQPSAHVTSFTAGASPVINVTTRELASQWDALFGDRAPLATLDEKGDRRRAILVRLRAPRLSAGGTSLRFQARVVDGKGGQLADRLAARADTVPASTDATTVAIDTTGAKPSVLQSAADPLHPDTPGLWVRIHVYLNSARQGGDGDRWCTANYGQSDGVCRGHFDSGLAGASFDHGGFSWAREPTGPLDLQLWAGPADKTNMTGLLTGTVANEVTNQWPVKGWLGNTGNPVVSGTDPAWTDAPGGPLDLDVFYSSTNEDYRVDVYGYVWAVHGV